MAKYIDQAGAQHFAEALMASTKTIGGQTIWGSGDIEAGGGTTTVTLTSVADFDTYKSVLESNDYKVVLFNFVSVDLGSKTVTIVNATLFNAYQPGEGSIIENGSIVFKDCRDGNSAAKPVTAQYQGLLITFQNTTKLQFINCHIVFGGDATINGQGIPTFANCTEVEIFQSYIESYGYGAGVLSSSSKLTLYDSTIKGFEFGKPTVLDLNSSSTVANNTLYITNCIINCNLENLGNITMNNGTGVDITNTLFIGSIMPGSLFAGTMRWYHNVIQCSFPEEGTGYFQPNDIVIRGNWDLANYKKRLSDFEYKTIYIAGAIKITNGEEIEFNNCNIISLPVYNNTFLNTYITASGASLKFKNCKTEYLNLSCTDCTVDFVGCNMILNAIQPPYRIFYSQSDVSRITIYDSNISGYAGPIDFLYGDFTCRIDGRNVLKNLIFNAITASDIKVETFSGRNPVNNGTDFKRCQFEGELSIKPQSASIISLNGVSFTECTFNNQPGDYMHYNVWRCRIKQANKSKYYASEDSSHPVGTDANGGFTILVS